MDMAPFKTDIEPIVTLADIYFQLKIISQIDELYMNYNKDILNSQASKADIHTIIKKSLSELLDNLLSKHQTQTVLSKYYTDQGTNLFLYFFLYEKILDHISKKQETTKGL